MTPLTYARILALLGLGSTTLLVEIFVPDLVDMGPERFMWRWWAVAFALLAAFALFFWVGGTLSPLADEGDLEARRRAAAEYPFRFARFGFSSAMLSGLGTIIFLYTLEGDLAYATLSGVITYLVFILPNLWIYLLLRRLLRRWAVGAARPEELGMRQSIGMRLAFAVQVPVVVCCVGMVLVEQEHGNRYAERLERYYKARHDRMLLGTLDVLKDRPRRARLFEDEGIEEGVIRSPSLWLLPPLLLLLIAGLAAALGRLLAYEITRDVRAISKGLHRLREATADEARGVGVGLAEMAELESAYEATLTGFARRQEELRAATRTRVEAERVKARFLAHLSHELKSPLNSVLGFSEILLTELDGPLTPAQRQEVSRIWRSGWRALRFILALLDRAAIEAPIGTPIKGIGGSVKGLLSALERSRPVDPTGDLEIRVTASSSANANLRCCMDADYTARALLLAAGLVSDSIDRGVVEITLKEEVGVVFVEIGVREAEGLDVAALHSTEAAPGELDPALAPAPLRLLRWLLHSQGGAMRLAHGGGPWPTIYVTLGGFAAARARSA